MKNSIIKYFLLINFDKALLLFVVVPVQKTGNDKMVHGQEKPMYV